MKFDLLNEIGSKDIGVAFTPQEFQRKTKELQSIVGRLLKARLKVDSDLGKIEKVIDKVFPDLDKLPNNLESDKIVQAWLDARNAISEAQEAMTKAARVARLKTKK